jgi:predicted RecB family endonuclease
MVGSGERLARHAGGEVKAMKAKGRKCRTVNVPSSMVPDEPNRPGRGKSIGEAEDRAGSGPDGEGCMSFWKQNEKLLLQRWETHRRQIEREVAERRRDLVRRNMRQSSEWSNYEPYTDWYLEREVESFIAAVDEVSSAHQLDIDDESLDEMDRMLAELVERRRQLASDEALREFGPQHTRVKGAARAGLLRVQSRRRTERERGAPPAVPPPVQRRVRNLPPLSSETPAATAEAATGSAASSAAPPAPTARAEAEAPIDTHTLADHLRRLAQLIQRLPDAEEQAETLEELQFVAEEATTEPDRRKLRMVASALERIKTRVGAVDGDTSGDAAAHADPIRRWFELTA